MSKLGVLGGMGPLATQLLYKMIIENTEASCDQEHIDMIILSHAKIPDRTAAIKSGNTKEVFHALLDDIIMLGKNGCTAIAIPCNTSHYFLSRIAGGIGYSYHKYGCIFNRGRNSRKTRCKKDRHTCNRRHALCRYI